MVKAKPKATIMVADGAGGMTEVLDKRFAPGEWPMQLEVSADDADAWLQHLSAECQRRGWSSSGIGQIDANENSGSITINAGDPGHLVLVVWERKRAGSMRVRARSEATSESQRAEARALIERVSERCRLRITEQFHKQWLLTYSGLPWCGELWLDDDTRLAKPSVQDDSALFGPRVIIVDARTYAIDWQDANSRFQVQLRELAVFLSVVMGCEVQVSPNGGRGWTWKAGANGEVECDVRNSGYWEKAWSKAMPEPGELRSVPLVPVLRPDFSVRGIDGTQSEQQLPADVGDLWRGFTSLTDESRKQFLQAGSLWQLAVSLGHDYQTASFSLMVVACESLKPPSRQFRNHNAYHVVEALLGKSRADILQQGPVPALDVRNAHLHWGEFRGAEFMQRAATSSFQDPSFDQIHRELSRITQAAVIEWLKCGGVVKLSPFKRRWTLRREIEHRAIYLLPAPFVGAFGMGWLVKALLSG